MNRSTVSGGSLRGRVALLLVVVCGSGSAADAPPGPVAEVELWRLDCGRVHVPDADFLSDQFRSAGRARDVVVSCYLVRHGEEYLLWDAGLPLSRLGQGGISVGGGPALLAQTLRTQLAVLGVSSSQVRRVALSHHHADHAGQVAEFPTATLMLGAEDVEVLRGARAAFNLDRSLFAPWLAGNGVLDPVAGDRDVFGDGTVTMLAAPGHTPGHHVLRVRLASGSVLLSGDLWHFHEQALVDGVPRINTSHSDTRDSMVRIAGIVGEEGAKLVIGHEPADVGKLPAFPQSAR